MDHCSWLVKGRRLCDGMRQESAGFSVGVQKPGLGTKVGLKQSRAAGSAGQPDSLVKKDALSMGRGSVICDV